ncbi:hypothetical protein [Chryseobacterium kwangjuense]|uniref:Transporter n=1 Tax=Chryseobacterium kwangjuense TaxID=267125 RepID=A0A135WMF1_9FLAO|nr:hypothetical protein [Chryseobacterium kwangjuense]KXH86071.1 hypothetical protein AU378_09580 [Chryseobacterium kwangjuense]
MKNQTLFYLCFFPAIMTTGLLQAQGCSDAGFCTVNSLKPQHSSDSLSLYKNQFKIGFSAGKADHSIATYSPYLEYNREISSKFGISLKASALSQTGNGISALWLSDIYINTNYRVQRNLSFTLGTKLPLNNGNTAKNGQTLPMDYQSSLGTWDIIVGAGYQAKKLQLALALQQPLTQNSNQFIAENTPVNSVWRDFQTTKDFKRSGDVLLRASYPFKITDQLQLTPSLLNIYHLSEDKFTNISGVEEEITGSQGLTMNGNLFIDYQLNRENALQFNVAAPFLYRDTRPDGLTRKFAATLEYSFNF